MYTLPKIHTGTPIQYKFEKDTLVLDSDSKELSAFILKPEKLTDRLTKTKIILVIYAGSTTLQFTLEPFADLPNKVRTRSTETQISTRPHNFENMALVYAGQHPQ